jgi:murein DD-endopeptidase MepM/ murein hydrolase activator NlpD
VVIEDRASGTFVALAHLRAGSLRVCVGDEVSVAQQLAECGNSGNSTQPHVHVQVMDGPDPASGRGVPMAFRGFREWPRGGRESVEREFGVPGEGAVVEALTGGQRLRPYG